MWVARASVVVDAARAEEITRLEDQLDGRRGGGRRLHRVGQHLLRIAPAVDGDDSCAGRHSGRRRGGTGDDVADVAVAADREPERFIEWGELERLRRRLDRDVRLVVVDESTA